MNEKADHTPGWSDAVRSSCLAEAVAEWVCVFDGSLRGLFANRGLLSARAGADAGPVAGRSLGDVLSCCRCRVGGPCGESPACAECGWLRAVEACTRGAPSDSRELRILTHDHAAYDFALTVRSLSEGGGGPRWLCVLRDSYAEKRLRVLERTFFHDVANLASGVRGLCDLSLDPGGSQDPEVPALIRDAADKLMNEVQRLRVLRVAENGDLEVFSAAVSSGDLLREIAARFSEEAKARHLEVVVRDGAANGLFESDREILSLILGDLFLNAVEASARKEQVTLACDIEGPQVVFRVGNSAVLTPEVRAHLFERSFTTRGAGKGVGAYRAKLLCERYLKGKLSCVSQEGSGTVVTCAVPFAAPGAPVCD